ncbi:MAG: helix-turn-helix domain-containing protein, partial [Woeseiaceae bacterium]
MVIVHAFGPDSAENLADATQGRARAGTFERQINLPAADDKPRKNGEYLTTLARGLSVLRSFTKERPEMTLSEVAAVTALSPAVARRCLNTLVDLGYVGRKGKLFLLTPEVMGFASAFLESMNLEEVVRPYLQEVRDTTGDSS